MATGRRFLRPLRESPRGQWVLWQERYPKLNAWAESSPEETFPFYRRPREHLKLLKSTHLPERFHE